MCFAWKKDEKKLYPNNYHGHLPVMGMRKFNLLLDFAVFYTFSTIIIYYNFLSLFIFIKKVFSKDAGSVLSNKFV